jgi:hypothetical protein
VRTDAETGEAQNAKDAAFSEAEEEMGPLPSLEIYDQYVFRSGDFTYTTFIAKVAPETENTWKPQLNWENDKYGWFAAEELPENLHFGVEAILAHKNVFDATPDLRFPAQ